MNIGHAVVIANAGEMSEKEWQGLRHKSVGSSETAAVMGMGRYGSPMEVWEAKTGRHTKDMNFAMSLGHIMEPVILGLAAAELGMEIDKPDLVLAHPDHPEMTCNLDGYATNPYGEVAIVEAKHAGSYLKSQLETWEENGVPVEGSATEGWWVQVQQQMAVTGIEKGYLAALCDKRFFVIPVLRNGGFIKAMERDIPEWFNRHVVGDEQPEFTGNDGPVVERLFPETDASAEDADMTPARVPLSRAASIKAQIKELKNELAVCEVQIKAQMGSSAAGFIGGEQVITSKNVTRTSIDAKKLRAEYPEIADECSKTSTSRRYSY